MVQFKCKMCGGTINVEEGKSTFQCEFCGTTQTVPSAIDNNKIAVLHNRANSLRLKNEFDKALANYENIIIENPNDAEAHWGALLCRYGIEYVDDPKTGRKIPTCHRTQTKSIFDDIDYKAAMDNSDVVAKQLYQDEAEQINKIQKSILAVSVNEKPYDIFICYKESDEYGKRTKDSVIAQELYDELNKKGYKVFFAKITLESKLGSQYEPYIFAALNSAKVMLVIGTKAEYFNAVWVKNEWARFLSILSESNGKKYIIPCYRDIDAYELPDELLSFQAQDMGKLGFIQDLTRGIDKLFNRNEDKKEEKVDVTQYASGVNVSSLLRRAEILLQSNNKEKANELLDEVLNNEPENAKAYALFAVMDLGFTKESDLEKSKSPLTNNANYNFAVQFADSNYKIVLKGYNDKILERAQIQQKETVYQDAINCKNNHKYEEAIRKFESIIDYKDTKVMIDNCKRDIEQFKENKYQQGLDFISKFAYDKALSIFNEIKGYKDSIELISKVNDLLRLESEYKKALNYARNNTINSFNEAILILSDITAYRDSSSLIQKYKEKIEELKARKEKTKFLFKRFSIISAICLFFIIVGIVLTINVFIPTHKYNKAMKYIESGNYESANALLLELNGYSDSVNQIEIVNAHKAFDADDYETGIDFIYNIGGTVNVSYDGNGGDVEVGNETIKRLSYITHKATRDGYTFYGWTVGEYKIYKNKDKYYCDLSLKSSWDLITYSLKYNLNGGNVTGELPKTYDIANPITLPNPTRKGYTFLGWKESKAENAIIDYEMSDGTFGNKEYTAFWVANKYQVSFELNGGQMSLDSLEVTFDGEYSLPLPKRVGYQFAGWYNKDKQITNGIWKQDNDLVLEANWNILTYSISYILNGGVNNVNNRSTYTIEDDFTIYAPNKEGYTFIGWTTNNDNNYSTELRIEKGTTENISYTANWSVNKYKILFNVNCDDVSTINDMEVTYDEDYLLPEIARKGYLFAGWFVENTKIESGKWKKADDITLTAKWVIIEYNINYDLNGGINNESNRLKYTIEDNFIIDIPTKKGYSFLGWKMSAKDVLQNTILISKGTIGDISLSANWEANKYTLTYDVNGGIDISQNTQEIEYESNYELLTPSRPGYTFDGWYTDDKLLNNGIWMFLTDISAKAHWSIITYTITYNLNGGETSNPKTYNYEMDDIAINDPSKEGYTFIGWTNDNILEPQKNYIISKNSTGNIELNANWQANKYTLTYDVNGGNDISQNTQEIEYESNYELLIPSRPGYTFAGWYNNDELLSNGIWMFLTDISAKAHWNIITYTITYNLNGGEISNPETYNYDMDDIEINDPLKDGYTFIGWTNDNILEPQKNYIIPKNSTGNIELNANWKANINSLKLTDGVNEKIIQGETNSWVRIPKNEFSQQDKNFVGWSSNNNGAVEYYDLDLFYIGVNREYTLHAIFEISRVSEYNNRDGWIPISTPEDMFNISNNMNGKYYLINDVDMYGYEWTPLGYEVHYERGVADIHNEFNGIFDGNGHVIYNFTSKLVQVSHSHGYYTTSSTDYISQGCGLFGYNNGKIINVCMYNANINVVFNQSSNSGRTSHMDKHYIYASILCAKNYGTIDNCTVQGDITIKSSLSLTPNTGIFGKQYLCYVSIGGICGFTQQPENDVNNSYAYIRCESNVDSMMGSTLPEISNIRTYISYEYDIFEKGYIWLKKTNNTYVFVDAKWHSLVVIPEINDSKNGYTFLGWSTAENGDVDYETNDLCYIPVDDDILILYPVWSVND